MAVLDNTTLKIQIQSLNLISGRSSSPRRSRRSHSKSPDRKKANDESGKKQGGAGPEGAVGMYISCWKSCITSISENEMNI